MPKRSPRHRPPGQRVFATIAERQAYYDAQRPSSTARGYDGEWRRLRAAFLVAHPLCCVVGCGKPATDADHIADVRRHPDLRLAWSNLRPYCHPHHSQRTARDQGFAVR